jgi:hypothetical protein
MTLEVISWNTVYTIAFNVPNWTIPINSFNLVVTSQLSNDVVFDVPLSVLETNDRYTLCEFTLPALEGNKHFNSMCNYTVYYDTGVWDKGSLKLIYSPGGNTCTTDYISDNENRQAIVYYEDCETSCTDELTLTNKFGTTGNGTYYENGTGYVNVVGGVPTLYQDVAPNGNYYKLYTHSSNNDWKLAVTFINGVIDLPPNSYSWFDFSSPTWFGQIEYTTEGVYYLPLSPNPSLDFDVTYPNCN